MRFLRSPHLIPRRFLNLHEYQAKRIMADYDINVQKFIVTEKGDGSADIKQRIQKMGVKDLVVKAQIHAGGRGKGKFTSGLESGVHLTDSVDRVLKLLPEMIGHNLITKQTPAEGVNVQKVMVAQALDIAKETYFAILLDRTVGGAVLIGSPDGGVNIEEVAEATPDRIHKEPVQDLETGPTAEQLRRLAKAMGFSAGSDTQQAVDQMHKLYKLFLNVDAIQVEINPFGQTPQGAIVCFDAKIAFDENAKFRHEELFTSFDRGEEDPREVEAAQYGLNYVAMEGNIGCLVNGAGLAMGTMDIIKLYGGSPANFLDVGGSATEEQVAQAFRLITSDSAVKVILVNIFGGIMRCDVIAKGIIQAAKSLDLKIPLVVRLEGSKVNEGKLLLEESGIKCIVANGLAQAAEKAVAALHA